MKIDEEPSYSDSIKAYSDYCNECISQLEETCDELINQVLFYKYIINSNFSEGDLLNGNVSGNLNAMTDNLGSLNESAKLLDGIIESLYLEENELKWSDFEKGELKKELLREYKLYKLIDK